MPKIINLQARTGADVQSDDASGGAGVTFVSLATEGASLKVGRGTVVGSTSVALMQFDLSSAASGPVFDFSLGQSFVSAVSIVFAAGANWAGMGGIYVKTSSTTYGWIPIVPTGVFTAAAR